MLRCEETSKSGLGLLATVLVGRMIALLSGCSPTQRCWEREPEEKYRRAPAPISVWRWVIEAVTPDIPWTPALGERLPS